MIESIKYKFILFCLLLVAIPVTGQVYTTSKAQVHSISTGGAVGYHYYGSSPSRSNAYGPSSSFYSTSRNISTGPNYAPPTSSIKVKTSFSTAASSIVGGITLTDDYTYEEENYSGPNRVPGVPGAAPIGDIPWVVLVLAAVVFLIVKKRKFE